jgi:hypothetical protein
MERLAGQEGRVTALEKEIAYLVAVAKAPLGRP